MKDLNLYQSGQAILEHLKRDEGSIAFDKAKALASENPKSPLILFALAKCYEAKKDTYHAIEAYTNVLKYDPSFISAAEKLIELNKDNYSLGELKYIYTLIVAQKEGTEEMYRFLDEFKNTEIKKKLSITKTQQSDNEAPRAKDNNYIKHLITQMHSEEARGDTCAIPSPITPPPQQPKIVEQPDIERLTNQSYGIETLTMAKLYIRQGLYEQAMGILLKLLKREPEAEDIQIEIDNLQILMREKKQEQR